MKKYVALIILIVCLGAAGVSAETPANYTLTINGETIDIGLDHSQVIRLKSGTELELLLEMKKQVYFTDEFISFAHDNGKSVSKADVAAGIKQIMISEAKGTLVLIQEYATMDPTFLLKQMLNEVTKQDLSFGYKMDEAPLTKTLADGTVLKGLTATLTYRIDTKYIDLVVYGKNDQGVLILTMIDKQNIPSDQGLIDLMWNTLQINF